MLRIEIVSVEIRRDGGNKSPDLSAGSPQARRRRVGSLSAAASCMIGVPQSTLRQWN
jgi:hypothetical protein